jgi:hypothetical protein
VGWFLGVWYLVFGYLVGGWRPESRYPPVSFLVGEAFSLDRRGWKAAPTEDTPIDLKSLGCMGLLRLPVFSA